MNQQKKLEFGKTIEVETKTLANFPLIQNKHFQNLVFIHFEYKRLLVRLTDNWSMQSKGDILF